jgi:Fe-S-cluster containining protein
MVECKNACGECCKWLIFPEIKEWDTPDIKAWMGARDIKIRENGSLKIFAPCPKLTEDGKCSINEQKPQVCKDFEPGSIPECPLFEKGGKGMKRIITVQNEDQVKAYQEARSAAGVEARKEFSIIDMKIDKAANGAVTIEGYANTKNKEDRYGDIPTVFTALRNFIYDLDDFHKNPVCLLDHYNCVENIAGSFNPKMGGYIMEDELGLKFKMVFSASDFPPVAHARTVYAEGHGRALSIGGNWFHEDKDNPSHLTFAKIYEVSLVGVGADPDALTRKGLDLPGEAEKGTARNLQDCIAVIEESIKAGRVLSPEDENALREAQERPNKMLIKEDESWLSH